MRNTKKTYNDDILDQAFNDFIQGNYDEEGVTTDSFPQEEIQEEEEEAMYEDVPEQVQSELQYRQETAYMDEPQLQSRRQAGQENIGFVNEEGGDSFYSDEVEGGDSMYRKPKDFYVSVKRPQEQPQEEQEEVNDGGQVEVEQQEQEDVFDDDDYIYDMDFSDFGGGNFKSSLKRVNRTATNKKQQKKVQRKGKAPAKRILRRKTSKPLSKSVLVNKSATIFGKTSNGVEAKTTKRIIVPSTQKVIIQGVDKFILGRGNEKVKNIGYYRGKKLKELVFIFHNDSALDFTIELFNPSMPLDYLHATSLNINNKVQVSGGITSYTDVLFNLLANPTHIPNAKFVFAGASYKQQIQQPLIFINKNIQGEQKIDPLQLPLQMDNLQVADDIVFFDIIGNLNRPFIPNGMDIIKYTVFAGNTVTFGFYFEQKDLKRFFYKEARESKKIL